MINKNFSRKCFTSLVLILSLFHIINIKAQVVINFPYSGAIVNWVAPAGVSNVKIECFGAQGGDVPGYSTGGKGACLTGNFTLTPGATYKILVGQKPLENGGGGGSFVTDAVNNPLIIAGAGGGGAGNCCGTVHNGVDGQITTFGTPGVNASGGTGGGGVGGNGGNPRGTDTQQSGGGGGLLTNGSNGDLGTLGGFSFISGGAGGCGGLCGGFGGGGSTHCSGACAAGVPGGAGGGGGGYSGGGSTGGGGQWGGGGGGGSINNGSSQINTAGCQIGNGLVRITVLYSVKILQTASVTCNGGLTAALVATVTGGSPGYSYTWTPSGVNTQSLIGIGAGVYTVTVKDVLGNLTSASYTVTQPTAVSGTISVSNANCPTSLGSATASASGGTPSYTYSWTPSGGTSSIASGLAVGVYTCTIKDLNNCTKIVTTTITSINPTPTITVNSGAICAGESFTIIPAGASTYTIQGGSAIVNPIVNSTYTVMGTSAAGCISSLVTSSVTINANPIITVNSGSICSGNSFTIVPAGASTYTIQGGTAIVTPLADATYTVKGTSVAGCVSGIVTSSVTVVSNPTISVSSGSICSGNSFTIVPAGANTYTIQGGVAIVNPLASTTYTVKGSSIAGCVSGIVTSSVTVVSNPTITVNSGPICAGESFTIIPAGASTYTIQGGSAIVNPIVNSTYTVVGTNAGGCVSSMVTSTVTVNANPIITVNSGSICSGNSFTIVPAGASSYTFQGGSAVVSPIVNSTYTVIGTSISGCISSMVTSSVTIIANPIITVNSGSICSGNSFTIVPAGASTYTIEGGSAVVSPMVSSTYTVLGTSTAGCISTIVTSTVTINATPIITVNSGTICAGQSFTIVPAGAISYTFQGGSSVVNPSVNSTYTVMGASVSGCISSTVTSGVTVNANPIISVNSGSICSGNSFTIVPAGASTYIIQGGSAVVSPIVNSTYTVVGTSTAGCISSIVSSSVTIESNPIITVNSGSICSGNSFTIVPAGASTYTIQGGNAVVNPIVSSTYTVEGTSVAGCISSIVTSSVNVVSNPTISVSSGSICSGNSFTISPSGASTYVIEGGTAIVSPLTNTTYTVKGTSISGCVSSASLTVTVTQTPSLTLSASSTTICEGSTTNLQASGASNYLWAPSGSLSSSTLPSVIATPAVTTMYIVVGNNGVCTDSKNIQITVIPKIIPMITPHDTAICFGKTIQLSASGGNQYLWSPVSTLSSPTSANVTAKPLTTTIYTVSVSLNNICPQTKSIKITVNPLPYVYAGVDTTINIDESYILHGTGNVEVGFVPLDGIPLNCNYCSSVEVNPKVNTCYTLKGITNFGCENSDDVCITVTKDYNIYIPNAFTPNGDTDNDVFMPVGYGLESYEMSIFDRWGNTIFKSSSERKGWDGSVKGIIAEAGVYVYRIVFKTMGNLEVTKVGHLTVLSRVK